MCAQVLELPLRTAVMVSQVYAGMWRRNGYSLQHQIFFYHNARCVGTVLYSINLTAKVRIQGMLMRIHNSKTYKLQQSFANLFVYISFQLRFFRFYDVFNQNFYKILSVH